MLNIQKHAILLTAIHLWLYMSLVQSAAHELLGHLLFMFKGKDALHHYGDSGDANEDLHNHISQAVYEATKNYNSIQ